VEVDYRGYEVNEYTVKKSVKCTEKQSSQPVPFLSLLSLSYKERWVYMRFVVITAVKVMMMSWVVMLCELVGRYQRFREMYCLHLQG
jgi:hypothetical protein